ncbi:tyrosine-type recombinase/integrase [Trichothermofontia sp.]
MVAQFPTKRYQHGTPKLEVDKGKLRIRIPAALMGGKRSILSLGLDDTPENRVTAEKRLAVMVADINIGQFDPTLERYRPKPHLAIVPDKPSATKLNPLTLWLDYVASRTGVSPSTVRGTYKPVERMLRSLPSNLGLHDATEARDYLLKRHSPDVVRRFIMQMNACCKWAIKSRVITANPYADLLGSVSIPKRKQNGVSDDIHPFTREERDAIIAAFESNQFHPARANHLSRHSHYAPYIKFLFFSGCRPSEAIGLQWKHVKDDRILFQQSVVDGGSSLVLKKGLKTQDYRYFPINNQLRSILDDIKPDNASPDDFVFPSPTGKHIDIGNFRNRVWKPILDALGIEYRKPYQTRHTFITLCLESGVDAKDVAKWVGNSPEIIYKHYASAKRDLSVPEL